MPHESTRAAGTASEPIAIIGMDSGDPSTCSSKFLFSRKYRNFEAAPAYKIVGLTHLVETGQVGPGDHVLIVAHGGGVSITCAVVRIDERPDWAAA